MAQRNAVKHGRLLADPDPHDPKRIEVRGPFGGYVPNCPTSVIGIGVDPGLLDFRAAVQLSGFVPHGEDLAPDYGWFQHKPAQMPLGGYVNGGGDSSGGGTGQPVVHIVYVPAEVSPNSVEENLVVTSKLGSTNGTIWQYPKYSGTDVWYSMQSIEQGLNNGETEGGDDAITTTIAEVWDHATYLPGHTVLLCDGIGIDYESQPIGLLRYYTGRTWGQFPRPSGVNNTFGCVSLCAHQDRVLALATIEDGVLHSNRIRWTTAGWSTVLASPIVLPATPTALLWNDAGAGALDIEEDVGAGVAIREIGDNIIAYCKKGIVILSRTGIYTRPYQRTVVTTKRGLIGTQAVTNIGGGVHFGIFTDGWFFVDTNGQFKEVGTTQIEGTTVRKWSTAFYNMLNTHQAYRTTVTYEPSRHFIKITFPGMEESTAPDTVWTYDIYGDRIWPDTYIGAKNNNPLCWGDVIVGETLSTGASEDTWDGVADGVTWDEYSASVWGGSSLLDKMLTHGTAEGYIFQHTPNLYTRDGDTPAFVYVSAPNSADDDSQFKQFQQILIHYLQMAQKTGTSLAPVIVSLLDGTTSEVVAQRVLTPTTNGTQLPNVVQAWFRNSLMQGQVSIMGTHPFVMRGFDLQWLPNMGDLR